MKAKTQSGQIIKGMKQQQLKFIVTVILFALHEREKPGNTHDLVPGLGIIPGIT